MKREEIVVLFSEVMREEFDRMLTDKVYERIDKIATERLDNIIDWIAKGEARQQMREEARAVARSMFNELMVIEVGAIMKVQMEEDRSYGEAT